MVVVVVVVVSKPFEKPQIAPTQRDFLFGTTRPPLQVLVLVHPNVLHGHWEEQGNVSICHRRHGLVIWRLRFEFQLTLSATADHLGCCCYWLRTLQIEIAVMIVMDLSQSYFCYCFVFL